MLRLLAVGAANSRRLSSHPLYLRMRELSVVANQTNLDCEGLQRPALQRQQLVQTFLIGP
jgi:hypothetical protein